MDVYKTSLLQCIANRKALISDRCIQTYSSFYAGYVYISVYTGFEFKIQSVLTLQIGERSYSVDEE